MMSGTNPSYDSPFHNLHKAPWFLGPQAENADLLKKLFSQIVDTHTSARLAYHPEDEAFITTEIKESAEFKQAAEHLCQEFTKLGELLAETSAPFYSPQYAVFEPSIPSMLGCLAAMLFNPNNVVFETNPNATLLELDAGMQLCDMIGYSRVGHIRPWGHITCDRTVANLESMWAARNLKFYPIALKEAMHPQGPLAFIAANFRIHKCATPWPNKISLFYDLDTWDLLNLRSEEILSIPNRLHAEFGISPTFLNKSLEPYLIQSLGKDVYEAKYQIRDAIQYLISSTMHCSWSKAAAITGNGSSNIVNIAVNDNARMDITALKTALERSLDKKQAVYAVVALIGSTEEGAVDPLDKIIELQKVFQAKGLSFLVHADAAWGGYFTSMIRDKSAQHTADRVPTDEEAPARTQISALTMLKEHTICQLEALKDSDSVTVDPAKSGYCIYPTGGLCCKDGRLKHMVTLATPYLNQGKNGENIGVYGVEGSKPSASVAALYLHHTVVGLHKEGHGSLLGEVCLSRARLSAHWAAMSNASTPYLVVPLNRLRAEPNETLVEEEKKFITANIIGKSHRDIVDNPDPEVVAELQSLGSDLNINAFACNFRMRSAIDPDVWSVNDDVEEANYLNRRIFDRLSATCVDDDPLTRPIYITSTTFAEEDYGKCLTTFKRRLGLETGSNQSLFVLRNVVMLPFQTTADYAGNATDMFRRTLVEEMEHVVARNRLFPQEHTFIMQGIDKLFLIYRPLFHKANARQQLIISADMARSIQWTRYTQAKDSHPNDIFTFNIPSATIDDIVACSPVDGYIYRKGTVVEQCTLSNIKILKNRSLASKWRDADYPQFYFPFYLYGTLDEQHIDHMLLKAPNAQLTAQRIELNLDTPLDELEDELGNGLLLYALLHESSMQPFDDNNPPSFFTPGAEFQVRIFSDPFSETATAHGPGLAPNFDGVHSPFDESMPLSWEVFQPLAVGTMQLGPDMFVDYTDLNKDDFAEEGRISSYTEKGVSEGKAGWRKMVSDRMDVAVGSGTGKPQPALPPASQPERPTVVN